MAMRTGGEAVVEALIAHGVDTLFGLPGMQNDWLFNALFDSRDRIKVVHTRHEQGVAYMALGYALATGDAGAFNVVPGPGLLNASAALATAYGLNAKVFCLTGQIASHQIGKGLGQLHEIPHQSEILRGLTKWSDIVLHPSDAGRKMAQAFYEMDSGRPRPVALEVPPDILKMRAEVPETAPNWGSINPLVDAGAIECAAKILGEARRPDDIRRQRRSGRQRGGNAAGGDAASAGCSLSHWSRHSRQSQLPQLENSRIPRVLQKD